LRNWSVWSFGAPRSPNSQQLKTTKGCNKKQSHGLPQNHLVAHEWKELATIQTD
jgi:hypothetical protein